MFGIEFISGFAIGLASGITLTIFISLIKRRRNSLKEIPFYEMGKSHDKIEPFIDIPLEEILLKKSKSNHSGISHLKEKIKRFQMRNRFYHRTK